LVKYAKCKTEDRWQKDKENYATNGQTAMELKALIKLENVLW